MKSLWDYPRHAHCPVRPPKLPLAGSLPTATLAPGQACSKNVVPGTGTWHFLGVKTILSKPANHATAADVEVRQLQATGKRIAADKKSILRFLAATGMYTTAGKLKTQFR